jgi:hypothetical protein
MKKDVVDKYTDLNKEELLLKIAHLEGENKALKENTRNKGCPYSPSLCVVRLYGIPLLKVTFFRHQHGLYL